MARSCHLEKDLKKEIILFVTRLLLAQPDYSPGCGELSKRYHKVVQKMLRNDEDSVQFQICR